MKTVQQYIIERTGSAYIRPCVREIGVGGFNRSCVGFYGSTNEYLHLMIQLIQELSTETVHEAINSSGWDDDGFDIVEETNELIGKLLSVTILPDGGCRIFWDKEEWVSIE